MADASRPRPSAVSVHVRRGDYLADGAYAACPPGYYAAPSITSRRLGRPLTCFVFSNDPGWARDNLSGAGNGGRGHQRRDTTGHFDMHLQSLCDHNIIANSTFSWWGAWLNDQPVQDRGRAERWFAPGKPDNPDICPPGWVRL